MAEVGRYEIRGWGAKRRMPTFDDLVFLTASLSRYPLEGYRERCDTTTVLGTRRASQPLELAIPITIAGMSFGALSAHAKEALGRAATAVGTSTTTGDGGMTPEERQASRLLVYQCLPSRYGFNLTDLQAADAIEVVIGQGAKPGGGGMLLGQKVSDRVAAMRTLPPGIDQRVRVAGTRTGPAPTTCGSRSRSCARPPAGRSRSTSSSAPPGSSTTSSWPWRRAPTSWWSTACRAGPGRRRPSSSSTPGSRPCAGRAHRRRGPAGHRHAGRGAAGRLRRHPLRRRRGQGAGARRRRGLDRRRRRCSRWAATGPPTAPAGGTTTPPPVTRRSAPRPGTATTATPACARWG